MSVIVCLKWVSHPGEPNDERFAGMSPADQCALEFALRLVADLDSPEKSRRIADAICAA